MRNVKTVRQQGKKKTSGSQAPRTGEGGDVALAMDESLMRSILRSSKDCIQVLDLHGHLLFMGENGLRAMEVPDFDAVKGCDWLEFWEADAKAAADSALEQARGGESGRF